MSVERSSIVVPFTEYLRHKQGKDNPILRLAKLASSIGGGIRQHPLGTFLAVAGVVVVYSGIRIVHDDRNYIDEPPLIVGEGKPTSAFPKEVVKTSMDDYQSLRDYLDNVLSGMSVGEDLKSIASLLPGNKFNYQIDLGLAVGVGEVVSDDGVVNRWLPVVTSETELPRATWKQKGESITDGVFFVTMFEWRNDGSILATRAIARQTSKGWEFNVVKHNKNGVQEELIKFPERFLPTQ